MLDLDIHFRRDGFALDVRGAFQQGITGLFGPSGSGKTTLLRLIAGLEKGTGRILAGDALLADSSRGVCVPAHRRGVGIVFQENRLFPHLNVEQNLRYGMRQSGDAASLFERVVDQLELAPLLKKHAHRLSGGEGRCVALGRALLSRPRLLLLDEPFTGIDGERKRRAIALIRWFAQTLGAGAFLVSHAIESVLALTDHLLVLKRGSVLGRGSYLDLLDCPSVFPVLASAGAASRMQMAIEWSDESHGVTYCRPLPEIRQQSRGGHLQRMPLVKVPFMPRPAGTELTALLNSADITLAETPSPALCAGGHGADINQLMGLVTQVIETGGRALCIVDVGFRLIVDLARHPMALDIRNGKTVCCTFRRESLSIWHGQHRCSF